MQKINKKKIIIPKGNEVKNRPNFILGMREKRIEEIVNSNKKNKKIDISLKN